MSNAAANRDKRNGQYAHELDAVCECGRRKGAHDAEAPWGYDSDDGECDGFKKTKPKR